jgi:lipopolysaccharide transport system ATP-binding protein
MSTEPTLQPPSIADEVLVRVENVSKKYCRSFRKSLWYGIKDIAHELNPFGTNTDKSSVVENGKQHKPTDTNLRKDEFWAVKDVSFELRRGECLGLIGHNGAGKTTLLKMLNGLIKPDGGRIEMKGNVGALIALGAGFNPVLSGRENIFVNASILGLKKSDVERKIDEIIDFAEIEEFIDSPVQAYSSGMQVRLGFAVATTFNPDVLILDEVLAVGDASFRSKCFQRIGKVLSKSAVIFVSHSDAQLQRICSALIWMNKGIVKNKGDTAQILQEYRKYQDEREGSAFSWTLGESVKSATALQTQITVRYGMSTKFSIVLDCEESIIITNIYIQWHRGGISVMQSEVPTHYIEKLVLEKGRNVIEVLSGPVNLAYGTYDVSFASFTANGKETIAHTYCALKVNVEGTLGIGPPVIIPTSVKLV